MVKNLLNVWAILLLIVFFSCSKDTDPEPEIEQPDQTVPEDTAVVFTSVFPPKVRIGDTVTISGNNLHRVLFLKLNDYHLNYDPFYLDSTTLKFIMPIVVDELIKVRAYVDTAYVDSSYVDIIGTFPLATNLDYDINEIQLVDDLLGFAAAEKELYRTLDGGYTWELLQSFPYNISAMDFIDANTGWIGLGWGADCLFHTTNGGSSFEAIAHLDDFMGKAIIDMHFSSPTNGYLMNYKGEVYKTTNNQDWELVYDFPFANEQTNFTEFSKLDILGDVMISSGTSAGAGDLPTVFVGRNEVFEFEFLNDMSWLRDACLVSATEAYLVAQDGTGERLYFASNLGNGWSLTSNKTIHNMYFFNREEGIGISSNGGYNYHTAAVTYDGGQTWKHEFILNEYHKVIDFHGNVGLIGGYRGYLWKHIFE